MSKKIKVLYEDSNILVIDKPSGILVHPSTPIQQVQDKPFRAGPEEKTIIDIFKKKYPKIEIAHRLDKETSGVMLLAKNKKAHEFLKSQFANREIKKIYLTIVSGFVKNDHGVINKPIGRSPKDFRRHLAGRGARGEMREAITEYKVLKRMLLPLDKGEVGRGSEIQLTSPQPSPYKGEGEKFTYLEVRPKTGRTHQIRAHLKFLNHPVVCDSLYNPGKPFPKDISRLALHAKSIEFKDMKGKIIKVESPLPLEFKKVVS